MEWINDAFTIIQAALAIIGALKILSRYTKWTWDDKLFDKLDEIGSQVKQIISIFKDK